MKLRAMDGFDMLGAEAPKPVVRSLSFSRTALALAAGAVGAALTPKHPVLAFLGVAAAASNAHAVVSGDRSLKDAIRRMGRHVVATAGSLSVPKYPAIAYVAGAVAGELLIDGEGGGIFEEWADYEGVKSRPRKDVIDVEFVETKTPGAMLQKVT